MLSTWYSRPITRLALFSVLVLISVIGLSSLEFGEGKNSGQFMYTIRIQHFGIDAEEMERSITIPLENLLSNIPGVSELRSQSELNTSRVDIVLQNDKYKKEVFFALRDAVDTLYLRLPSSVQRPQIFSSSGDDRPLIIVSFPKEQRSLNLMRNVIERDLKPQLENLTETGEIEIGGGSPLEIHVEVDEKKMHQAGISEQNLSSVLQREYGRIPVGSIEDQQLVYKLTLDGRISSIEKLGKILIPNYAEQFIPLEEIASINYAPKELESINRVNGKEHVALYLKSSGTGSPVTLSHRVSSILEGFSFADSEILYDYGELLEQAILKLLISLGISILVLSSFILLMLRSWKIAGILTLHLMLSLLLTLALFSIAGVQVSLGILSGLGVAIGLIADSAIILSITAMKDLKDVGKLAGPIGASTLTTLVAMFPLLFIPDTGSDLVEMLVAFSVILVTSVLLAFLFLPPLIKGAGKRIKLFRRLMFPSVHISPKFQTVTFILIVGVVPVLFILMPWNISIEESEDVLFCHVEFPSGTDIEYVDKKLIEIGDFILANPGVSRVESYARRNNGSISVRFDSKMISRAEIYNYVDSSNDWLYDSFLFISNPDKDNLQITIDLIGPEYSYLRTTLRELASRLEEEEWVDNVILHFKEGDPSYVLSLKSAALANAGLEPARIADSLRWSVFGPVSLKWMDNDKEMDLRIMGPEPANLEDLNLIRVQNRENSSVPITVLGTFVESEGMGRISRINRQRANSLSLTTPIKNMSQLETLIHEVIDNYPLDDGNGFRIDPKIEKIQNQYRSLIFALIITVFGIYILLAAQYESLTAPVVVFLSIPAAILPSLLFLWLSGWALTTTSLLGLIVVSGLVVNNCILLVDEALSRPTDISSLRQTIRHSLRRRMEDLVLTTGSTLSGLLPLIFLPGVTHSLRVLSAIVFLGILGSFLITAFILPGIINLSPILIRQYPNLQKYEESQRSDGVNE